MGNQNGGDKGQQGQQGGSTGGSGEERPQGIVIGDKTYTPEEVAQIVAQQKELEQKVAKYADVDKALSRYEMDPKGFIEHADGAFAVLSELIDKKVIDEKGNVLIQPGTPPAKDKGNEMDDLAALLGQQGSGNQDGDNALPPAAAKALQSISTLEEKLDKVVNTLSKLDETQADIIRVNLQDKIMAKHDILEEKDVSAILGIAMKDRTKDVYAHAEDYAKQKKERLDQMKAEWAKELGIDLKRYNENKLLESGPQGGASILTKGKKLAFRGRGRGDDVVTPLQATMEYLSRVREQGGR